MGDRFIIAGEGRCGQNRFLSVVVELAQEWKVVIKGGDRYSIQSQLLRLNSSLPTTLD